MQKPHPIARVLTYLEKFAGRPWYTPVVALMAALDLFILVIPTDALLLSNVALRPKKWIQIAIWFTAGSGLGSLALSLLIHHYGIDFLGTVGIHPETSSTWESTARWIRDYQGPALAVFAGGPFPLQPAVMVSAVARVSPWAIFLWVSLGRALKFFFFAWAATHAPKLLGKLWGVRSEVEHYEAVKREVTAPKPKVG